MDTFLIALLLVFAIALGGRDQLIVGQFTDAVGRSVPLLATGIACAAASAGIMGWAGAQVGALLPPRAADILVSIALLICAADLVWPVRVKPMKEPTRSFVAIAAVLVVRQCMDSARFVIFALAASAVYPGTAAIGGAIGGAAAIALGWAAGKERLEQWPLRRLRLVLAAGLIPAAFIIGFDAWNGAA